MTKGLICDCLVDSYKELALFFCIKMELRVVFTRGDQLIQLILHASVHNDLVEHARIGGVVHQYVYLPQALCCKVWRQDLLQQFCCCLNIPRHLKQLFPQLFCVDGELKGEISCLAHESEGETKREGLTVCRRSFASDRSIT